MDRNRPPSESSGVSRTCYTIVLFGRKAILKRIMMRGILGKDEFIQTRSDCVLGESDRYKVINTPDVFSKDNKHPDQHLIDCMALSLPGPHLFILAIDLENAQEHRIVEQIHKLQENFGNDVCGHLVVTLPDIESYHSLSPLQEQFNVLLATLNENLGNECSSWCKEWPFVFQHNNYSKHVVRRRRDTLLRHSRVTDGDYYRTDFLTGDHSENKTTDSHVAAEKVMDPPLHLKPEPAPLYAPALEPALEPAPALGRIEYPPTQPLFFNIIFLGRSGSGKSASGNTILAALKSRHRFTSRVQSEVVTSVCEAETVEAYGTKLTIVDTPDFLHDRMKDSQMQLGVCRSYFVPGCYIVLLVLKVGRFTEVDLLKKLEEKLQTRFRDNTFLLLTHGEELKGRPSEFFNSNPELRKIADQCNHRSHVFNNKKQSSEQVIKLLTKIPNYQQRFPKLEEKNVCCVG